MLQKLIECISDEDFFFLVLLSWLQFKINIVDMYIRHHSRFFDCLAHPNLSATLATDQK